MTEIAKGLERKDELHGTPLTAVMLMAQYGEFVKNFYVLTRTQASRSIRLAIGGLRKNAVVRKLALELTARTADRTGLDKTQTRIRATETKPNRPDMISIVVDFGTMVTVSAIATTIPDTGPHLGEVVVQVYRVRAWNGQGFIDDPRVYESNSGAEPADLAHVTATAPANDLLVTFATEIKTEKLLIDVMSAVPLAEVDERIELLLPEPPSGLELITQDGVVVFNHPARVALTTATAIDEFTWNQDGKRRVDLRSVLAARTGDPTSHDPVPLDLTFNALVPGLLQMVEVPGREVAWLERIALGPDGPGELHFEEEGRSTLALTVPDETGYRYTKVESARVIAVGKIGPERVVPADGPIASTLAEMTLGPGVSACARLPAGTGLGTLTGVRLALAAGAGGAEVRVVVLEHVEAALYEGEASEPGPPIKGGQTAPIVLAEAASATAAPWTTFTLDKGIELTEDKRPWIAIQVTRGKVRWAMANDPAARVALRRGPPEGPWTKLPSVFRAAPAAGMDDLRQHGARLRAIGLAPPDHPLPPFTFAIKNATVAATNPIGLSPTAKGVASTWHAGTTGTTAPQPGQPPPNLAIATPGSLVLEVVSHVAGNLTLRDLDLTLVTT